MNRISTLAIVSLLAYPVLADSPSFVPGEWIVTLATKSRLRSMLEKASAEEYASVRDAASRDLSDSIGVPLTLGSASGGGTWVVHIDVDRALRSLEREIGRLDGVREVRRLSSETDLRKGVAADRGLKVALDSDSGRADIIRAVGRTSLPVEVEDVESGPASAFLVRVDWRGLTRTLVERFETNAEVESVELNTLQGPAPAQTGGALRSRGLACSA